jgi:hypothetical protein
MEQLTSFVSSRGILKSCGSHNLRPMSSSTQIDEDLVARHRPGGSIYVCTSALESFATSTLSQIKTPFVLVTGDSDDQINTEFVSRPSISRLLDHPLLIAWFAQNLSLRHPKISFLPIGLDYHTMWEKPLFWGLSALSPLAQERTLVNTLENSPAFLDRYVTGYCNWHFDDRGERQTCFDQIDRSACFLEPTRWPRSTTWARQSECMFVISPEGVGMDCHRTWEALLLGCVPVVKRNALSAVFSDLPVMVVEAWSDVTKPNLLAYAQSLQDRKFDFSSLFRDHWVRKIYQARASPMEPMTMRDFRKLLVRRTG